MINRDGGIQIILILYECPKYYDIGNVVKNFSNRTKYNMIFDYIAFASKQCMIKLTILDRCQVEQLYFHSLLWTSQPVQDNEAYTAVKRLPWTQASHLKEKYSVFNLNFCRKIDKLNIAL